jgi:hypothetical protein
VVWISCILCLLAIKVDYDRIVIPRFPGGQPARSEFDLFSLVAWGQLESSSAGRAITILAKIQNLSLRIARGKLLF